MEPYSVGTWLQQRRNQLRLTQKEVGAVALCSAAMIRKIEADERQPSVELAYLLADALQIPSEQREVFVAVARGERPLVELVEERRSSVFTRDALLPVAYLLVRRQPTIDSVRQAWQLIGLSEQASLFSRWSLFIAFAERFQPPELLLLPPEEIEAAKAYGRSLDPDTAIADLLEELPQLGWET